MTRFVFALITVLACSSAFSGELKHKVTYAAESLQQQRLSTVEALVENYASRQDLALAPKTTPLFLVNGKHGRLSAEAMNEALSGAKAVEVMSDGDAIVVNVLI